MKEEDKVPELPEKKEEEIMSVPKISDTETIDDFFQDVSHIMEKKGQEVNKDISKYTLFDDADNED